MRTAAVLWRSAHPGPTLVVSAIVAALGVAAGLDAGRRPSAGNAGTHPMDRRSGDTASRPPVAA